MGRHPTVGPQTLDLLIGVRIPASQLGFLLTLPTPTRLGYLQLYEAVLMV